MKLRPLWRDEVREVDRIAIEQFGLAGLVLMENAGRNAAHWIATHLPPGDVCVLCGKGNNGGDGYVIARHLETYSAEFSDRSPAASDGWRVRIVSVVDCGQLSGDAAINHDVAVRSSIPIVTADDAVALAQCVGEPNIVVDCLLGTGATGAPRGLYADAIRLANRVSATRVAIDVPSGLDCDTGIASDPTLIADVTLTFVAEKIGFRHPPARSLVGRVVPLSIGIPKKLLSRYQAENQETAV